MKHPLRRFSICLAGLVFLVFLVSSCGGKKRSSGPPVAPRVTVASGTEPSPAPYPADVTRPPHPTASGPTIRVLLRERFGELHLRNATLHPDILVRAVDGRIVLEVFGEQGGAALEQGDGFRLEPSTGSLLQVGDRSYRGAVEVFINPLGDPIVVNVLLLEDYLKSVVPNELGPRRFPYLEALKAQSVAARTFALAGMGSNGRRGFDLFADQRSQIYTGTAVEQDISTQAVEETEDVVALFEGRPITAFYSSTCGGKTADYHEVFQRPEIPYLRGGVDCPDQASPFYQWEERIPVSKIQDRIERYAGVGRLRELKVQYRDRTGRVNEMLFKGDQGEQVVRGLDVRYALGLRSQLITSLHTDRGRDGFVTAIEVQGRGYGHGVGLCQIGAVEFARRGLDFEEILKTYYPGVQVSRAGDRE